MSDKKSNDPVRAADIARMVRAMDKPMPPSLKNLILAKTVMKSKDKTKDHTRDKTKDKGREMDKEMEI